ncbi:MAG: hypothetical protein Q8P67_01575 [archaeon]|nr:hypothetical protein [archaeon]
MIGLDILWSTITITSEENGSKKIGKLFGRNVVGFSVPYNVPQQSQKLKEQPDLRRSFTSFGIKGKREREREREEKEEESNE